MSYCYNKHHVDNHYIYIYIYISQMLIASLRWMWAQCTIRRGTPCRIFAASTCKNMCFAIVCGNGRKLQFGSSSWNHMRFESYPLKRSVSTLTKNIII